jgi:hypothetical protein
MRLKARAIVSFLRSDKSNSWISSIVTYGDGGGNPSRASANRLIKEKLKLQPYVFMGHKGDMYGIKVIDCEILLKKPIIKLI